MTLVVAFLHSKFVLVSPHESAMPYCPAARMERQNASEALRGTSVCAGMGTSLVTTAEPA